jgi:HTH-type transcriptional regulator / antitoxin HigA
MSSKNQYAPDLVTPPGEILLEKLDEMEMTQAELAERIGRTRKTVNEIVKGKAPILPETALQLERVLSIPARFWTSAEGQYREFLAREAERERLAGQLEWLKRIPTRRMVQAGWLPPRADAVAALQDVLNFFGVASVEALSRILSERCLALRQSVVHQVEPYPLLAWIRRGEIEAQQRHCAAYDEKAFRRVLDDIRKLTREPVNVYTTRMIELCASAGVAVVFVPELPGARAWGVTHWLSPEKAILQLSLRGKTDDRLWFTFFHEAAHILLHPKRDIFVELDGGGADSREREADRFASEFLIPPAAWQLVTQAQPKSAVEVQALAKRLRIASGILVGRLQREKLIPSTHLNALKVELQFKVPA